MNLYRWGGAVRLVSFGVVASLWTGCAAPRVDFARGLATPTAAEGKRWSKVRDQWTRHVHLFNDWDPAINGDITLMVPEVRGAWQDKRAEQRRLPEADRAALVAKERKVAGDNIELLMFIEAARWDWNDFSQPNTMWTLTLSDGTRAVSSIERMPVRDKADEWATTWPDTTPFTRIWRVRFPSKYPDGSPVIEPSTRLLIARIAGPLGVAEARWQAE